MITKLREMKRSMFLLMGTVLLIAVGVIFGPSILSVVSAQVAGPEHGGDRTRIHICVNTESGLMVMVGRFQDCSGFPGSWVPVDWAVQGPPGPQPESMDWSKVTNKPAGFDDDVDDNTQLAEAEVETFITNDAIDLNQATTLAGESISTGEHTSNLPWTALTDIPPDIADGDQDTQLSESEVEGFVVNGALDLFESTTLSGESISTGEHTSNLSWEDIVDLPGGFADGVDDDILASLTCEDVQIVRWVISSWVCSDQSARISTLDFDRIANYSSIVKGSDGLGLISYPIASGSLKAAHCENIRCTTAIHSTLDDGGNGSAFTGYTSIAIGTDDMPLISYADRTNFLLKVAHCEDITCSSATLTTLDEATDFLWWTSITIGGDGFGLISYSENGRDDLKVAHCENIACSIATITTIDSTPQSGLFTSITTGTDGFGLISYQDGSGALGGNLKVAHCENPICSESTVTILDNQGNAGLFTSVTTGSDGMGLISYYERVSNGSILKVAHCANIACTSATVTPLDLIDSGTATSITIGLDGFGLVAYGSGFAHCDNLTCTRATLSRVGGSQSALTIGDDGLGLISFSANGLKVAHCAHHVICDP